MCKRGCQNHLKGCTICTSGMDVPAKLHRLYSCITVHLDCCTLRLLCCAKLHLPCMQESLCALPTTLRAIWPCRYAIQSISSLKVHDDLRNIDCHANMRCLETQKYATWPRHRFLQCISISFHAPENVGLNGLYGSQLRPSAVAIRSVQAM